MSFDKVLKFAGVSAVLCFALPQLATTQQPGCAPCHAYSNYSCAPHCQTHHCPPAYKHCYEGAPHIHWRRGCPHPICNPCDLPNWGYFEPCWTPFPFPPNYAHCPVLPPAATVQLNPHINPNMPPQQYAPQYAPRPMPPQGYTQPPVPRNGYEELPAPMPLPKRPPM